MTMSIVHRATGITLYCGTVLLALWFVAAAFGDSSLGVVHWVFASWLGQVILFALTWVLFHHMLGGVRHFIWDSNHGFSHEARFGLARANLVGGLVLTLIAWAAFVWF